MFDLPALFFLPALQTAPTRKTITPSFSTAPAQLFRLSTEQNFALVRRGAQPPCYLQGTSRAVGCWHFPCARSLCREVDGVSSFYLFTQSTRSTRPHVGAPCRVLRYVRRCLGSRIDNGACLFTTTAKTLALGASNVCLVGENPTSSIPALYGFEGLWSYDYGHA